jgi:hypothetical protein
VWYSPLESARRRCRASLTTALRAIWILRWTCYWKVTADKSFLGLPLGALVFTRAEEIRYVHQTEVAPGVKTRFPGHQPDTKHAWGNGWLLRTTTLGVAGTTGREV